MPVVVDLAAMRDAIAALGGDPAKINPLVPAELVIDHSVQVDVFGTPRRVRAQRRARVRAQRRALRVPALGPAGVRATSRSCRPTPGIVHQVNLEYLARVVFVDERAGAPPLAYPDTLVGTDSHTTMVNGLGVLGWGVGGIEAEAAMLGQPMSMLLPQVVGFRLHGALREGATATDLVLTVTEMLRAKGVVGRFVEFFGAGLAALPLADRATIGNMSPEFGSTCAIFPIDAETLRYLRFTGRAAGAGRARRGLRARAGPLARRAPRGRGLQRHARARPRRRSSRASPGRAGRRTACRCSAGARALPRGARRRSATRAGRDAAVARRRRARATATS